MALLNVDINDKMYPVLSEIVDAILSTSDSKYVEEISLANYCLMAGNRICPTRLHIYVETTLDFVNTDLYNVLDKLEEKFEDKFHLINSVEPNYVERCTDVIPLYVNRVNLQL